MDLNQDMRSHRSTYKIMVKVRAFFSCPDGKPKMYCKIKPFSLLVERDDFSLLKFVDGIGAHVEWGSKQYVSLWRALDDASVEIRSDDDLLAWMDMHNETGVVHIVAQVNDYFGPIEQVTPMKRRCHPIDKIRQMIVTKFDVRRRIGNKMKGRIIPSIVKELNEKSKNLPGFQVTRHNDVEAEVSFVTKGGQAMRHGINLQLKTCTCRAWQVCGKPCDHALAFIGYIREGDMNDYVHDYYSVEKFKKAYAGQFAPMTFKHQWTKVDIGYTIKKPKLRRKPGRPRKQRIKGSEEARSSRRRRKCSECDEFGHTSRSCQGGPTAKEKKRRRLSSAQSEEGSNDNSTAQSPAPTTRGRGRATSNTGSTNASEAMGIPPSGRGTGRGRGRGRGRGGLAYWFSTSA